MKTETSQHYVKYDILRSIALVCFVIAHTKAKGMLHQLRNFDVPLLFIVAGSVFIASYMKNRPPYGRYVVSRIARLLGPSWVFLVIFFLSSAALFRIAGRPWPFSTSTIAASLTLLDGIGYVWVIRVFILVAIAAPFLARLHFRIRSDWLYYGIIATAFAVYEVVHILLPAFDNQFADVVVGLCVYYLVPFGCIFALGIRVRPASRKQLTLMSAFFLALFVGWLVWSYVTEGFFRPTQAVKYPPGLGYVSYAVAASLVLYAAFASYRARGNRFERLLGFIGSSTLWIYLWHIYILYLFRWTGEYIGYAELAPGIQGVMIIVPAILITFVQKRLVSRICAYPRIGESTRKALDILFLR